MSLTESKEMADTQQSTALAFDGLYGELAQLGLPLPLMAGLKLNNLTLESAMWNVRCTATGFLMSLFWPSGGEKMTNAKKKDAPENAGRPPRLRPAKPQPSLMRVGRRIQ